eukprot:COSAG06_NODE_8621_length_2113_cov_4.315789_1_plen_200_part_10
MRPAVLGLVACLAVQNAVAQGCTSDEDCAEGMICDDYDFCVQGSPGGGTATGGDQDCLTCHNQCNCDSDDTSCQSCHSACDDGTDCQPGMQSGCGDGTVPDGSGGCCYETIEDVPEDQVAEDLAVASACATQLAACEGVASFLELGPEVCGTETPACVATIDACEDSGADCAAAEGCEEVESDMGTSCAPTAGIARDVFD